MYHPARMHQCREMLNSQLDQFQELLDNAVDDACFLPTL